MIKAQDASEGKIYFLVADSIQICKFKIIKINKMVDESGESIVSSVSVNRIDSGTYIQISGDTELEETGIQEEKKIISNQRITRSSVIDKILSTIPLEKDPVWENVYNEVIKIYGGTEKDRLNILSQAKERWGWYKRGKKVNPYL